MKRALFSSVFRLFKIEMLMNSFRVRAMILLWTLMILFGFCVAGQQHNTQTQVSNR